LAHETRNPLNLIRGFAQMIATQADGSPGVRNHATAIIEETDRVTVQLNEFINYSKPREPQLAAVEVSRLVADVSRTLVPDLEEKHLELRQPESKLWIEADEQLFRQALFNVLLNATQAVAAPACRPSSGLRFSNRTSRCDPRALASASRSSRKLPRRIIGK
jgi:signal transduction histidine kinase